MAFSFGIISALIAARKMRGQSRLQQLLAKQKKQGSIQVTVYQFPTKILFSICFLLLLSFFIEWFRSQIHLQLAANQIVQLNPTDTSIKLIQQSSLMLPQNSQNSRDFDLVKLNKTINMIHFVVFVTLAFLASSLELRMIKCLKSEKSICSVVYKYFGLKQERETYHTKSEDKIFIWEMGESRFSNTNYYFSIRVGADASWEIIRKSNIYDSRAAAIKIATALELPFSTKISKLNLEESH